MSTLLVRGFEPQFGHCDVHLDLFYPDEDPKDEIEDAIPPPGPKVFQVGSSSDENVAPGEVQGIAVAAESLSRVDGSAIDDDSSSDWGDSSEDSGKESLSRIDESAIDDDDSSDWEDSPEDSGKSSFDKTILHGDSNANLTSHRSLLTLRIKAHNELARKLGIIPQSQSQSTSALLRCQTPSSAPPATAGSPNNSNNQQLIVKKDEVPRSAALPIRSTTSTANYLRYQPAMSPRTTRRNMLATELPEWLRRALLWERQQQRSTADAVLKRRYTSHDVANLKQPPEHEKALTGDCWENYGVGYYW